MALDRNNRVSQDRQPSPFRRASKFDHHDIPAKLPSPPQEDGPHPRHAIRPRSLVDAYRDASKHAMSSTYEEYNYVTTPSPRSKRQAINALSPISQTSPPPQELEDAYRRIDEDDALADLVRDYDWEPQFSARPGSRNRPPSPRAKYTNGGRASANGRSISDASFGDDLGDHRARKSRDYTKDEERLKRVTGQRSPVFSRAQVGRDALTAHNLRRRMEDKTEVDQQMLEADMNGVPSPNVPSGWGHRAGYRQEWERKPTQPSISEEEKEKARRRWSPMTEEIQAPRSTRTSPRSPARALSARSALEERTANPHMQAIREDYGEAQSGPKPTSPTSGGEPIPNSPITVFKNASFARPSLSKRDSRDLLRKLSRTETPKIEHVQTPEPLKLFQSKVYDKTPRVTGAWIDTPMTQRVAEKVELPEDLTKDIIPPRITDDPKDTAPTKLMEVESKPGEPKPAQTSEKEPLSEPLSGKQSRPALPRPHLPKSALETVIEDASSGKDVEFGEDTIESLQAFMDGPGEPKIEEDDEAYEKAVLAQLENGSSKENNAGNLDSLNAKLNSLMRHIDEVKKGLDGLENYVTQDTAIVSEASSLNKKSLQSLHLHTSDSGTGRGTTPSDGRVYAAIPLPRLWTGSPRSQRLRPTKLGWFIIISLSWYIIECLMWDRYSHPEISESCEGYCLQPDAPLYPWVTVTMLWRWSHLSTIFTPIFALCVAFSRLVAQLMGLSDGYVDDAPELGNIVGEIRINGTPVAFPWLSAPTPENIVPQPQQVYYTQQPVQTQPVWSVRDPPPQRWDNDQLLGEDIMDDDEYL
ncbi:hypothetical protein DTO012A9_2549 [Penicillium roqueforti]|nr:hypothetical protein DTO012A9_2549 [Penicillium roqueforti]